MSGLRGVGGWVSGLGGPGGGYRHRSLPPPEMATATVGTHPTGMPSCFILANKKHESSN